MSKEYDHQIKLVIVGNSNVGKSSLMLRFSDDQFQESYLTTIGVDFRFKTLKIDDKNVKLQIWDTAGQERFRTITNAYYKGADGIVIVYDITNKQSFDDICSYWIKEVENYGEKDVDILLLGNKSDLQNLQQVEYEKGNNFAKEKKLLFHETSAKINSNVQIGFMELTKNIMEKKKAKGLTGNELNQRQTLQQGIPQQRQTSWWCSLI